MVNYWNFCKSGNITSFYLSYSDLEKWMYQNKADYTGDFVDGCLLDSFVLLTKRGYAFVYEHFINSCSSDYAVYFVSYNPYKAKEKNKKEYDMLWSKWYEFAEKSEMIN